ncbi:DUF7550 family protein [Halocalculus aciditolerans]|uniref:Uncharacterized protein n=1 Tax=Halocalculus aciditolerans TaxID=1383812 RepID=A0A830FL41_9EURY|nr:hypothetical protein [Halocalculus aciditolerans]GGL57045.1 hypothetical protein GCM10009039_14030 [Halocalculus aciditolerans]
MGDTPDDADENGAEADNVEETEPKHVGRTTAPQQAYTSRQVGLGLLVLVVGVAVAYGLPFLL